MNTDRGNHVTHGSTRELPVIASHKKARERPWSRVWVMRERLYKTFPYRCSFVSIRGSTPPVYSREFARFPYEGGREMEGGKRGFGESRPKRLQPGIILRIDVVDLPRPDAGELNHGVSFGVREVNHAGRHGSEAACLQGVSRVRIELFAHA